MFMNLKSQPDADEDDFFKHESSRDPPSLSDKGKLYSGIKSDLTSCIPGIYNSKECNLNIFDMVGVIYMLKHGKMVTVF